MTEPWLHTSPDALRGTCYIELLPGPYRDKCWNEGSLFITEEAWGFLEPLVERRFPEYDRFAFTEVGSECWRTILADLRDLQRALEASLSDEELRALVRFTHRDTQRSFFVDRERNVDRLRTLVGTLLTWVDRQLVNHDRISILGL